jgi:hypothetical protein
MPTRKKLIEVALPRDAINVASAREKSTRRGHGHPSTLHLWWEQTGQSTRASDSLCSRIRKAVGYAPARFEATSTDYPWHEPGCRRTI